jgi:hypothetical protein
MKKITIIAWYVDGTVAAFGFDSKEDLIWWVHNEGDHLVEYEQVNYEYICPRSEPKTMC